MTAAKAYVAAITAFITYVGARNIALPWWVEALALASIAGVTVFLTPNQIPPEDN